MNIDRNFSSLQSEEYMLINGGTNAFWYCVGAAAGLMYVIFY